MIPSLTFAGMLARKHTFTLPLDYQQPNGESICVFARELVSPENQDKPLPF